MSIPVWQYKLEEAEFKTKKDPAKMVEWLLHSTGLPDHVLAAKLQRYGYVPPVAEPAVKPKVKTKKGKSRE